MNKKMNKSFKCKVCVDAGKPEKICNSHCVKNADGTTDCPTLLEQKCRYCCKKGHTVKYCPTLSKQQKEEKKVNNRNNYLNETNAKINTKSNTNSKKTIKNQFQALCDDTSDDEEYTTIKYKNHKNTSNNIINELSFPPLSTLNSLSKKNVTPLSYKNLIHLTKEQYEQEQIAKEEAKALKRLNEKKIIKEEISIVAAPDAHLQKVPRKRNWADCYSSDEEDEDEEDKKEQFKKNYINPYDEDDNLEVEFY